MTANTICPGDRYCMPSCWLSSLQLGGKIDLTRTRLNSAMPAERSANSNEVSFSRCLPTPLVRNAPFGTGPIYFFLQQTRHRRGVKRPVSSRCTTPPDSTTRLVRSRPLFLFQSIPSYIIRSRTPLLQSIHRLVFAEHFAHRLREFAERAPLANSRDYPLHPILFVFGRSLDPPQRLSGRLRVSLPPHARNDLLLFLL